MAPSFTQTKKLADAGNAEAQYSLGKMCATGKGAPQDFAEAAKWFRKAAEQGHADAQASLSSAYDSGLGVPKDEDEAMKWFRKAAERGHAGSQVKLGFAYMNGKGVPKDEVEAYAWFNISVISLSPEALMFNSRDVRKEVKLTPEEKARAQKRSTELFNEIEARKKAAGK